MERFDEKHNKGHNTKGETGTKVRRKLNSRTKEKS